MNEMRTYQTRLALSCEQAALLDAYAALYGKAERSLFARLSAGESLSVLKREFIGGLGITARQFNALAAGVRGKIASVKEVRDRLIEFAKRRIKRAEDVLAEITDKWKRHQKRRRIATLQARLANLESERDAGKMGICFGSRKLFREQFALEKNDFASHEEWLAAWRQARSSQFFAMGSRDETAGCQSCVAAVQDDGSVTLRLRLPDALGAGKHLAIARVRFAYGHDAIVAAIGRNLSEDQAEWQAISYRFVHDARGWRVFVSIAIPEVAVISHRQAGVIGVDINADRLAVTETDRFGNPVGSWVIHCVTYGRTSERRAAIVGDAVKQVVAIAVDRRKPIAIEKLDFWKKRATLEAASGKHARMLCAFAYRRIQAVIRARSYEAGIAVLETNPAYSSIIGKYKFASRYGLSAHNAAACVLARRVADLGERLPSQFQVTPQLLAKNRSGHVWSLWAIVSRRDRVAHAARRRPGCSTTRSPAARALVSTARPVIPPPSAGAIPAREPSSALFGGRLGQWG